MGPNTPHPSSELRSSNAPDATELAHQHEEALLDDALAATFPCSDPISLTIDEPPALAGGQQSSESREKRH